MAIKRLHRSWRMLPFLIISKKKRWMEVSKPATIISSSEEPASFSSIRMILEHVDQDIGPIAKFRVKGKVQDYRPADIRKFVFVRLVENALDVLDR
jgi:hypothetical protein